MQIGFILSLNLLKMIYSFCAEGRYQTMHHALMDVFIDRTTDQKNLNVNIHGTFAHKELLLNFFQSVNDNPEYAGHVIVISGDMNVDAREIDTGLRDRGCKISAIFDHSPDRCPWNKS